MDIVGNRTLRSLLAEKVEKYPDKTFLLFEDALGRRSKLTYEAFADKVFRLSRGLMNVGVNKGDRVTLHLSNSPEFLVTWFAIANIGAIMVPTNTLSTADEMAYILQHSESVLLITEQEYLDKLLPLRAALPNLRGVVVARCQEASSETQSLDTLMTEPVASAPVPLSATDVTAMLYTSGTTSKPKGVLVTHANYLYAGEVMSKSIRLGPEDRQFIVLPLFHGNAQYYSTMSALTAGASIALAERFSASRYFKQAQQFEATVGSLFAAPIRMILAQEYNPADAENGLRLVWFAQSISPAQLESFETRFQTRLLQMYGMTETMATPLMNPYAGKVNNMSIGRPVLGYEVKVVDGEGREVPVGTVGQLVVKGVPGRTIMSGYFRNPTATAETIRDGWLRTGDNARVDEDGYFHFVDRAKDMIKRSGENVAASEVEQVLSLHPSVYDSAVIGIPDDLRDESIKAYVILRANQSVSEAELIEFCKVRLAKFKVPEYVEFVTELPRTSVGKIQKHVLRQRHARGVNRQPSDQVDSLGLGSVNSDVIVN